MGDKSASNGLDSTINLDTTDDDDSVLEVSSDTVTEFQPVRPGGVKLDETIDIEDSEEEEEQYTTSVQSPPRPNNNTTAFATPSAFQSTSTPLVQPHRKELVPADSTPAAAANNASHFVDELQDELHQTGDDDEGNCVGNDSTLPSRAILPDQAASVSSGQVETEEEKELSDENDDDASSTTDGDDDDGEDGNNSEVDASKLPETCSVLKATNGCTVYLVGTAHFSKESQEDVAKVIRTVRPNVVMLELCKKRINILHMDEKDIERESKNLNTSKMIALIREKGKIQGALYILLLSMSAHLTKELGMAPGGEFRTAFREAQRLPGCLIHLGDRGIDVTMKRALFSLSLWQKIRLAFNIMTTNETITKEDVERCKEKDLLESMLEDMAGDFPALSRVFVQERDLFLCYSLQMAAESAAKKAAAKGSVVGVVGIGHTPGIMRHWEKVLPSEVKKISEIPSASLGERILGWTFRLSMYSVAAYAGYRVLRRPVGSLVRQLKAS